MKSTREIDELIREALGPTDGELWDELGEQSMAELVTETFFGQRKLLNVSSMVFGFGVMVVAVYCIYQMLTVQDLRMVLLWFAGAAACFGSIWAMKVWSWLELTRITMTREIKRVELQLAQLSQRIGS